MLCSAVHFNALLANVPVVVAMIAFGWSRRRSDILEVVLPSLAIAYCGYLGLALAVVPSAIIVPPPELHGSLVGIPGPLRERWPLVLFAGLPYALVLAVAVALPASKLRLGPRETAADGDPIGTFLRARAEAAQVQKTDDGSGPSP